MHEIFSTGFYATNNQCSQNIASYLANSPTKFLIYVHFSFFFKNPLSSKYDSICYIYCIKSVVNIEKVIFLGVLKASFNSEIFNACPSLLIYKNVQCSDSSPNVLGLQNWGQHFKVFLSCELCDALCSILKLNDILTVS